MPGTIAQRRAGRENYLAKLTCRFAAHQILHETGPERFKRSRDPYAVTRLAVGRDLFTYPAAMDFFVYSRDAKGATALRDDDELAEEHWSYMDRFAESMIVRGPTLGSDPDVATGSLHVLGLPSVAAAHEFVAREPNGRAGVYAEHLVWRFENLLGRTMWDFSGAADEPRFLIIARSHRGQSSETSGAVAAKRLPAELRERLILYGALSMLDNAEPIGVALALQAPDRKALDTLLTNERLGLDAGAELEIHNWEFGGRR